MISNTKQLGVEFQTLSGASSFGTLDILELGIGRRFFRSGLALVGCLFLTLLMIGVPLLHFILVPAGLIISLVVGGRVFSRKELIAGGRGPCPKCQAAVVIFKRSLKLPFQECCEHCRKEFTVQYSSH